MSPPRYFARSASDRTDDWPHWFVADREQGCLNVTVPLMRATFSLAGGFMPFLPRAFAEQLAAHSNAVAEAARTQR